MQRNAPQSSAVRSRTLVVRMGGEPYLVAGCGNATSGHPNGGLEPTGEASRPLAAVERPREIAPAPYAELEIRFAQVRSHGLGRQPLRLGDARYVHAGREVPRHGELPL